MAQKTKKQDIDKILAEFKTPVSATPSNTFDLTTFAAYGLGVAILPAYLFLSVFDVALTDFGLVYVAVIAFTTALLTIAYKNLATNAQLRLNASRTQFNKWKSANNKKEAIAWSIFLNNAIFFAAFAFIVFYMLQSVDPRYRYTLGSSAAAALVWQLSPNL